MASASSKLTRLMLSMLKVLQRHEHQALVCGLTGLYSCQWRQEHSPDQPGSFCHSKLESGSFVLIVLTFGLSLAFLYIWSEAQNDYNDFDWFTFGKLGFWFPWSLVLLILAVCLFTYITFLLVLAVCLLSEGQKLYLHRCHKVGITLILILSIAALSALCGMWSQEWKTVRLSFQITAPYLHIGAVVVMTLLSWPIALQVFQVEIRVRRMAIIGMYVAALLTLYLIPLATYSPCIKERNKLGMAPALIGHRGVPMLAPENTCMSFEKAVEAGADGLETDVTISYDGVPFLLHDDNLRRTTNVRDVFPNLTNTSPAMFTWRELERLNAGSWFLSQDPFGTASSLSVEERSQAQNQSLCTFRAFLDLAAEHEKLVIFDLYRPPTDHPYHDAWISRILDVIQNESTIRSSQVLWLPSDQRELVQNKNPELQQITGKRAAAEDLQLWNISRLNIHYSSMSETEIRNYTAANISTNLYVISEPWLFSLAWCAGARSVTTNAVHILKKLPKPVFLMAPDEYRLVWILTDMLSLTLVLGIFLFHWWRQKKLVFSVNDRSTQDPGPYM